jgi:hypothetical protein
MTNSADHFHASYTCDGKYVYVSSFKRKAGMRSPMVNKPASHLGPPGFKSSQRLDNLTSVFSWVF